MHLSSQSFRRFTLWVLLAGFAFTGFFLQAQTEHAVRVSESAVPDAPMPSGQQQPSNDSSDSSTAQQPKSQRDQAAEDLKKEEKQRILGIMPDFNMIDNANAPPLSPGQKFHLMFRSSTDPYAFGLAAIVAGFSQARDTFPGYGQGAEGYFKRFGATYADAFDGNFWGNAVLPVVLHEDPRYFRKGSGNVGGRILHAAISTVWCRRDSGTWGPNYSNVVGNIIAGGISNVYYPESDRGVSLAFSNALTVTAEGAVGAQLVEFWPDIAHHFMKKRMQKANAAQDAASPRQ